MTFSTPPMAFLLRFLRARFWLAVLILAAACSPKGTMDEEEEDPIATPTPYALTLPATFPQNPTIPTDNPLTNEGVQLGRMLFYETRLSRDNTLSCGSCHQQSKAFTDGRARSLGVDGRQHPRGAMSLTNLLWETTLNWDGAATTLETQARIPIENEVELHQSLAVGVAKLQQTDLYPPLFLKAFGSKTITEENTLKALAQFERTLISANSRFDRYYAGDRSVLTPDEVQGLLLFNNHPEPSHGIAGANCFHCHGGTLFTARDFFNNGLDLSFADNGRGQATGQAFDNGKFRAPTLRNIALTAPYMHDGRFATLEEVVDHYSDHVQRQSPNIDPNMLDASNVPFGSQVSLSATQKRQLVAFLKTLTDTTFVHDKRFANPFTP
ncbi:cytochrome-c peroxidase [Hymenobacter aerilatus]|uniref:Cytochrome-c peroxidase n=1 Tax=Hymenobacter aerilatus TaxID=2932251 RepID=A0A8T9SVL3_9BACT|nr:cytochrome c peroxidase [Hymenobacter aerilatus]UOR03799.1 cytochrome-c peroxidase [Hymenobacter aerilatus]